MFIIIIEKHGHLRAFSRSCSNCPGSYADGPEIADLHYNSLYSPREFMLFHARFVFLLSTSLNAQSIVKIVSGNVYEVVNNDTNIIIGINTVVDNSNTLLFV